MLRAASRQLAGVQRVAARRNASTLAVENLEARWKTLSTQEQNSIAKQLEEAQKGDWKVLSQEDKKAACKYPNLYYHTLSSTRFFWRVTPAFPFSCIMGPSIRLSFNSFTFIVHSMHLYLPTYSCTRC